MTVRSLPDQISLVDMLETVAERVGDKTALWFDDEPVSYSEILSRSRSLANALADLGVGRGDTVAAFMQNAAEQIYLIFAMSYLGAIEVPINTTYRGSFLSHVARTARTKVILTDAALAPFVAAVAQDLPEAAHLVVRGDTDANVRHLDVHPLESVLAAASHRPNGHPASWTDPVSIQFTSGTTGPSKGAVLTQNYLVKWAEQFSACWCESEDDRFLTTTPLFHMAAKGVGVLGSLYRGASCAVDSGFHVSTFWDRVRRYHAVSTVILGPMAMMLWNQEHKEADGQTSMRRPVVVPAPADLLRQMEQRWNCQFLGFYGLSEAAPLFIGGVAEPLEPGTSGRPNDAYFDVAICGDDGQPVAPGLVGEVVCRPKRPHVMFEHYFGDEAATEAAFRDGWFHTGDLGSIDEERNFRFADRKKDYIRRRGENISSFEVETAVMMHPSVEEAAAISVPSALTEDEVKLCVVLNTAISEAELLEYCYRNMPYFAVPRYIEFLSDLPHTPSHRVEKYKLRDAGITKATWDRDVAGYRVTRTEFRRPDGSVLRG